MCGLRSSSRYLGRTTRENVSVKVYVIGNWGDDFTILDCGLQNFSMAFCTAGCGPLQAWRPQSPFVPAVAMPQRASSMRPMREMMDFMMVDRMVEIRFR